MGNFHDSTGRYRRTRTAVIPVVFPCRLDGTPMTDFVNEAAPSMGYDLANNEASSIRWNNDAAPGAVVSEPIDVPRDRKPGTPLSVKFSASKSGVTVGDTCAWTVGAFFQSPGDLHDADADAGGDTGAMAAPTAAAKTIQATQTRDIASGDIPAAPATLTLTVKPKAGALGTDDVWLHKCWIEYEQIINNDTL